MGYFSWLTADTEESIRVGGKAYLLQPDKPPIFEESYNGYGDFGGIDAYSWLADTNYPDPSRSAEASRKLGLAIGIGHVYQDTKTQEYWSVFHGYELPGITVKQFKENFSTPNPEWGGLSASAAEKSGRLVRMRIRDILEVKYLLKFSFDENAKYEDLPASKNDPTQGYF